MAEKTLLRTICVDTLTQIQENQYMMDKKKPGHDQWKDYASEVWSFITELQRLGFEIILVIGPPGTGKSSGMATLPPDTNIWFNADNKNPVWKGGKQEYGKKNNPRPNYHSIPTTYGEIIDHIQGAMEAGMFEEERYAFLTGHTENFKEGPVQRVRLKTMGQLNNKMQVEGKLETVLYSGVEKDDKGELNYILETQNNGYNTCRSPQGAFEGKIPNDYNFIVKTLLEY